MSASIPVRSSAALLRPQEMAAADNRAIAAGRSGRDLMGNAGLAVAHAVLRLGARGPIAVLAGPGKNGGDGYAAAAELRRRGIETHLFALSPEPKDADSAFYLHALQLPVEPLSQFEPERFGVVVDALFGAGLSRALAGEVASVVERLNRSPARILSVDLPSGVDGEDGQARGAAVRAEATVTFFRRKPGHLLLPGRDLCGALEVVDIGIDADVLDAIAPKTFANEPALFAPRLLRPQAVHHKYDRGHVGVFSGGAARTGAARLSATAALRGGAGLVTVLSPPRAVLANAAHLTAVMLEAVTDEDALATRLRDERLATFVLGPGFGDLEKARAFTLRILAAGRRLVLDADGITAFADGPEGLFDRAKADSEALVLTPHAGEFKRLFPDLADRPSKLERARAAAERAGAIVILKGSDTVIASPDGRAAIDAQGTPVLATAGSGDVLTGLVAAQLANGVPAFEAACAAVWLHGVAAREFGLGLIAEDLPGLIPAALRKLADAASEL